MTAPVGFKSTVQVEQEKSPKLDKASVIFNYINQRYVACSGREFELTLSVDNLQAEIYTDEEIMPNAKEVKEALTKAGFNLHKVGDKQIAYARRVSVL